MVAMQSFEFMTVPEVAVCLRCGVQVVYKMIREEEVPSFRRGRCLLIPQSAVENYVQSLLPPRPGKA